MALKTGAGLTRSFLHRIGKATDSRCQCGEREDTGHVILACPRHSRPRALLRERLREARLPLSLPALFCTSKGQPLLALFLDEAGYGGAANG